MSDTPRTDELVRQGEPGSEFANLARALERENADLNRIVTALQGEVVGQTVRADNAERENAALREAALAGMDAIISLVGAHGEITNWPEWDACSRFVHDHSALVANPPPAGDASNTAVQNTSERKA